MVAFSVYSHCLKCLYLGTVSVGRCCRIVGVFSLVMVSSSRFHTNAHKSLSTNRTTALRQTSGQWSVVCAYPLLSFVRTTWMCFIVLGCFSLHNAPWPISLPPQRSQTDAPGNQKLPALPAFALFQEVAQWRESPRRAAASPRRGKASFSADHSHQHLPP